MRHVLGSTSGEISGLKDLSVDGGVVHDTIGHVDATTIDSDTDLGFCAPVYTESNDSAREGTIEGVSGQNETGKRRIVAPHDLVSFNRLLTRLKI